MNVLVLEPYRGGSHQAFLNGWQQVSRHQYTVRGLPAHHWKWRMRHAPVTFATELSAEMAVELTAESESESTADGGGPGWDVLFCSDMLNLAEFRGLARPEVARLPAVVYFHENQWAYPVREASERDYHFGFTNFTTALSAEAVWFNSAYNRDTMLGTLSEFLERMPDHAPRQAIETIAAKSKIMPPGIEPINARGERDDGPLWIVWAARWEHDKNPAAFFSALRELVSRDFPFRVSVLGQSFRDQPVVFAEARQWLGDRVRDWGWLPDRDAYVRALTRADVFVSTATHEFFGLAALEAASAGVHPLLPERLAYPEVWALAGNPANTRFFYEGSPASLADALVALNLERCHHPAMFEQGRRQAQNVAQLYDWQLQGPLLDMELEAVV